ncbi:MAG: STAS/SEC14 domain-containing protein [Novosphingobium sp.]|nr:STAS/SEC14 domain-containing protein [Novosphingobium sp.]MBO9601491.1 STAS/SEC14 domain-containing protein [Novosphingobium sp.]
MIDYRSPDGGVMEFHVSGKVTKDEIDATWTRLRADLPATGKIRVLEVIDHLEGIEPAAFWEDLRQGLPMFGRIERAAVVSDRRWIEVLSRIGNVFSSGEIRTFEPGEIAAARAWLKAA